MPQTAPRRSHTAMLKIASLLAVAVALAAVTYFSTDSRGRLPQMPVVSFTPDEEHAALASLEMRVGAFSPTEEERTLVQQLEELHITETSTAPDLPPPPNLKYLVTALRDVLTAFAQKNRGRFLLLGDMLALGFHRSLETLLEEKASKNPSKKTIDVSLLEVRRRGGAFFRRALARGAITPEGKLNASRIAPEVLFRYRWRYLGGLELTLGFTDTEKKALYDFIARFSSATPEARRLHAVDELASLDTSYDVPIAKAMVFYDANKRAEALKTLEKTQKKGRSDEVLSRFVKLLAQ